MRRMSEGKRRLALIIACDRYSDPELKLLRAPSQDAEALASILENPKIGGFRVTILIDKPHEDVRDKIDEFLQSCNKGDTVLLYFSCHGIKDRNAKLYFATITTNRKRLRTTGIESNFVNEVLDDCRAQRKVVLLDCCYSGAFEEGRASRDDKQVNATQFFGRGNVIITASDSMQYAFEGDKIERLKGGGSYFTGALIKGLETGEADLDLDGEITYRELYNYVYDSVRKRTADQTPTLNTRGVEGEFVIFNNPNTNPDPVINREKENNRDFNRESYKRGRVHEEQVHEPEHWPLTWSPLRVSRIFTAAIAFLVSVIGIQSIMEGYVGVISPPQENSMSVFLLFSIGISSVLLVTGIEHTMGGLLRYRNQNARHIIIGIILIVLNSYAIASGILLYSNEKSFYNTLQFTILVLASVAICGISSILFGKENKKMTSWSRLLSVGNGALAIVTSAVGIVIFGIVIFGMGLSSPYDTLDYDLVLLIMLEFWLWTYGMSLIAPEIAEERQYNNK